MTELSPVLRAESVSVHLLKNAAPVVQDVTFSVSPGTCVAVVGANGAGKSTLLRALAGLSAGVVTGIVTIGGADVSRLSARDLATRRAFVSQDNAMPFAFTVREAVALGGGTAQNGNDALSRFDLSDLANRSVLALSGGERQRVALARAWAQAAPLLFLDEPTAHQDLRHAGRVLSGVRAYVQENLTERAAVAVLHDLNLAKDWADAVLLLKSGRVAAWGVPDAVLTDAILSAAYDVAVETAPFIHAAP